MSPPRNVLVQRGPEQLNPAPQRPMWDQGNATEAEPLGRNIGSALRWVTDVPAATSYSGSSLVSSTSS